MKEDKKDKVIEKKNTVKVIVISVNVLIALIVCICILIKFYG